MNKPETQLTLQEHISDIFARACKNNEYFGNDGWYELHTPTVRNEITNLFQQALTTLKPGCVDCGKKRCENCERLWQT